MGAGPAPPALARPGRIRWVICALLFAAIAFNYVVAERAALPD
jgi:hypothetical protein